MEKRRCEWVGKDETYITYHDTEWGVPQKDNLAQFEFLSLETFQAGLSWLTILRKRENFRRAFEGLDWERVACFDDKKIEELMKDSGIVRNRAKITATISNARLFPSILEEFGTFYDYLLSFSQGNRVINQWKSISEIPAKTELSDKISSDLRRRGFKFVGSTIVYAHLQASGIVNDHTTDCFRYREV